MNSCDVVEVVQNIWRLSSSEMNVFALNIVKDASKMERQDTEPLFLSSLTCHSEIEAFFRIRWDIRDIMRCTLLLLDDQHV